MKQDAHRNWRVWHAPHAPRQFLHVPWALLFGLLLTGCGGGDAPPASMAAPQQASSGPSPSTGHSTSPGREKPAPSTGTVDAPLPSSASLAQLSALPYMSSLSDREKAGLLMLLPSKSSSQRLELINMYPSLVKLPETQKELLLDRLAKIVPVTESERR